MTMMMLRIGKITAELTIVVEYDDMVLMHHNNTTSHQQQQQKC